MEVPRYQIVLFDDNYTVNRCGYESTTCLPAYDMNDLRFQFVTDFTSIDGDNQTNLIAIPCDVCGDYTPQEVLDIFLGAGSPGHLIAELPEDLSDGNYLWTFRPVPASVNITYSEGECFTLCLYKVTFDKNVFTFISGECIGQSNCFKKIEDLCYTTKIKYQFNESSMGFYGDTPTLTVRLPMYLSRPQFPGEEKGYQKSDGTFLKLSERINKEWNLTTDWIPEALHERIRVALSADFIQIWNENENLALEGVYRDADYDIQWHEEVDYPVAKATTKIKKRILQNSVNSNCV